ncbi:hypothetical protein MRB53_010405 [Persea americana]|uniref:Uncharacterized protein n=1 Tax=Persea americana TaxID=3435 RepID=A0ACC2LSG1_PERAE|nr:hypothetical protein MRB53_010405 [Persea americana]
MPMRRCASMLLRSRYSNLNLNLNLNLLPSCHFSSLSTPTKPSLFQNPPWLELLRTSISFRDLSLGQCAHACIITSGLSSDRFFTNNLITMYAKNGYLTHARHLFDKTTDRDLVTWNSILTAYAALSTEFGDTKQGLLLFREMLFSSIPSTRLTLAPVLKLCLQSELPDTAETVHGYALKVALDWDIFVSGALVNIYAKFGRIKNARYLFDEMPERDVVLWNVMIKGYMQMGLEYEANLLFSELHRSRLHPDDVSVRCILGGSSDRGSVEQVQAYAIKICLFKENSDVVAWNKMLSGFFQGGKNEDVVEYFVEMKRSNVEFDNVTFIIILSAITSANDLDLGEQIHGVAIKSGFDSEISVANNLINMYSKTGGLDCMQRVFNEMKELDLVSWNTVISSYAQNGCEEKSIMLFLAMSCDGVSPDQFTLASVLRGCTAITEGSFLGKQVHVHALKTGLLADVFVYTSLIDVYAKNQNVQDAESLFSDMNGYDLASCNAMIAGYVTNGENIKALSLFSSINKRGDRLNQFMLATAIKACSCLVGLEQGKQLHAHSVKLGFDSDLCISSGILDLYLKCGDTRDAYVVFGDISEPDEVAWTSMISGCVENGDDEYALLLYHQMRLLGVLPDEFTFATLIKACSCLAALEHGKQIHANAIKFDLVSDTFVGTSIIDMYAKCGCVEESYQLFKRIGVRSIASWNAMVMGFAQHGNAEEALHIFQMMRHLGVQPDGITFIGVLSACSHSGLVSEAYMYFGLMYKDYGIKPEIEHYSCLVDVLSRAGLVDEAEKLIDSMPFEASASMCRALLGACRIKGNVEIGKQVATRLLHLEPLDSSAYVLLSNIYAAANRWDDVADARKMMKTRKVKKDPGFSWIEIKNKVHLFVVDDRLHPEADAIYHKLDDLMSEMRDMFPIHRFCAS